MARDKSLAMILCNGLGRIALDDDDDVLDVLSLDSRIALDGDDVLDVLSLDS
ncbi:hypothetical protein Tco_0438721, partial [Tanacetum coccineum]